MKNKEKQLLQIFQFIIIAATMYSCSLLKKTKHKKSKDKFINVFYDETGFDLEKIELSQSEYIYKICYDSTKPTTNHSTERAIIIDSGEPNPIIKLLVMHYTSVPLKKTIQIFTEENAKIPVSAHYVITETEGPNINAGNIIEIVPETKRARHAGLSFWQKKNNLPGCNENLNDCSIGIENVNKGIIYNNSTIQELAKQGQILKPTQEYSITWFLFDPIQINTLGIISKYIIGKYKINPTCVVGHADIAPNRKQDPGILFPWKLLYENYGVGAWLEEKELNLQYMKDNFHPEEEFPNEPNVEFVSKYLAKYGYNCPITNDENNQNFKDALYAFQAHFSRNQKVNEYGSKLNMHDQLWIYSLVLKYKNFLE